MRVTAVEAQKTSVVADEPARPDCEHRFDEQHQDWIEAQELHVEQHGLWNDDIRTW